MWQYTTHIQYILAQLMMKTTRATTVAALESAEREQRVQEYFIFIEAATVVCIISTIQKYIPHQPIQNGIHKKNSTPILTRNVRFGCKSVCCHELYTTTTTTKNWIYSISNAYRWSFSSYTLQQQQHQQEGERKKRNSYE